MNYTPGPWTVEEDDDGNCWMRIPDGHDLCFGDLETTDGCCYANAYLMTAAPELYEACKDLLQACEMRRNWDILGEDEFNEEYPDEDGWAHGDVDENFIRAMDVVRSAINKAERRK